MKYVYWKSRLKKCNKFDCEHFDHPSVFLKPSKIQMIRLECITCIHLRRQDNYTKKGD